MLHTCFTAVTSVWLTFISQPAPGEAEQQETVDKDLATVVAELHCPSLEVRLEAIAELRHYGNRARVAVPKLIDFLNKGHHLEQRQAHLRPQACCDGRR